MSSETETILTTLKVPQLRNILKIGNLTTTGNKSVLIARIIENINNPKIKHKVDEYVATANNIINSNKSTSSNFEPTFEQLQDKEKHNIAQSLNKFTVAELKQILKEFSIPTSGTKDVIINTIINNMYREPLKNMVHQKINTKLDIERASSSKRPNDITTDLKPIVHHIPRNIHAKNTHRKMEIVSSIGWMYKDTIKRLNWNEITTIIIGDTRFEIEENDFLLFVEALNMNTSITNLRIINVKPTPATIQLIKEILEWNRIESFSFSSSENNLITTQLLKSIGEGVSNTNVLKSLTLNMKLFTEDLGILSEYLSKNTSVRNLAIPFSHIGSSKIYGKDSIYGADAVAKMIFSCQSLEYLDLNNNKNLSMSHLLSSAIHIHPYLSSINLSDNNMLDNDIILLCDGLLGSHVEKIDISYNTKLGKRAIRAISNAIVNGLGLTALNLSGLTMPEGTLDDLGINLIKSKKLKTLQLSGCTLTEKDDLVISKLLQANFIGTLTIASTTFGGHKMEHIEQFCDAIKSNTALWYLNVSNTIDPEDVKLFLEAIIVNNSIEILSMNSVHVGDLGYLITQKLEITNILRRLDISYANLSPTSQQNIYDGLKQNHTLTDISLESFGDLANDITRILKRNKKRYDKINKSLVSSLLDIM